MTASATRNLANYVSGFSNGDLTERSVEAVQRVLLDTLAVTALGATYEAPKILTAVALESAGDGTSTIVGHPAGVDAPTAALANGMAGHFLDYDDYASGMFSHPSVAILPALLALGERYELTGLDIVRAYVAGFEAGYLVSCCINPTHHQHGWHSTGTVGTVAAVFGAANLLSLSPEETISAAAIGASSAAGLRGNFGSDIKPFHAGNAARSAVLAVELSRRGIVGNGEVYEKNMGFFETFSPDPSNIDMSVLDPIESERDLVIDGDAITVKLFPSCGSTHCPIGATLRLSEEHGLTPANVERIDVGLTDVSFKSLQYPRPSRGLEGKFSAHYTVARALHDGKVGIDDFTDEAVQQPEILELLPRIHQSVDQELTDSYEFGSVRGARLTIQTKDGRTISDVELVPPGAGANAAPELFRAKFEDCLTRSNIQGGSEQILASVQKIVDCTNLRDLGMLWRSGS